MRRPAAVIFDFDETIVDLEPQHSAAHRALCQDLGADYDEMPESFRTSSGMRIIDDIREMTAQFGWTQDEDELLARRQRHFDEACRNANLEALPGVKKTIRDLQQMQMRLAITSSAVRESIELVLEQLHIRDAFELIVDGSEVERGKPDPGAYLVTARKLGVAPDECVVFEDSHVGVVAAKRAGMYCIAVRNPHAKTHQDLSAADVVVSAMDEIDVSKMIRAWTAAAG